VKGAPTTPRTSDTAQVCMNGRVNNARSFHHGPELRETACDTYAEPTPQRLHGERLGPSRSR
jgi:hypothetical protein